MKKYILTSAMFDGQVIFGYDESLSIITFYNNESAMDLKAHSWLLDRLPRTLAEVQVLAGRIKGTLQEAPQDISWDCFWDIYGRKRNPKRCKPMYEALSDEDKLLCILRIQPYFKFCQRTGFRGVADPDTYLRNRYFDTDWDKEVK